MFNLNDVISEWDINENAIIIEPQEDFNAGIIGVSEDKCHFIYSYDRIVENLAKNLMKKPECSEMTFDDCLRDACEFVDYNTIRSLPYQDKNYVPIIIYEIAEYWSDENEKEN